MVYYSGAHEAHCPSPLGGMSIMRRISRVVLKDIAGLRAQGLTPGEISWEIGANIDTITEAINYLDREASPEEKNAVYWPEQPPSPAKSQSGEGKTAAPPILTNSGISKEHLNKTASVADEAARLGECHAYHGALSKVAFLDLFDLNIDDIRDGYSATSLYHLYLQSRIRTRVRY